jgi:hypothetical protein
MILNEERSETDSDERVRYFTGRWSVIGRANLRNMYAPIIGSALDRYSSRSATRGRRTRRDTWG